MHEGPAELRGAPAVCTFPFPIYLTNSDFWAEVREHPCGGTQPLPKQLQDPVSRGVSLETLSAHGETSPTHTRTGVHTATHAHVRKHCLCAHNLMHTPQMRVHTHTHAHTDALPSLLCL